MEQYTADPDLPAAEGSGSDQAFLSPRQVTELIGVEESTLAAWRRRGIGPACYRINGHLIRYDKAEVLIWLRSQGSTSSHQRRRLRTTEPHLDDHLTGALVERILGWRIGPDRFLIGGRQWLPRWRFQPLKRLDDAFRLLEGAAAEEYTLRSEKGGFWATVRIARITGEAHEPTQSRAITIAVARAVGLKV